MGNSEEKLDYYFKVLSNRIRRNILLLLEEESLCAGDIIKHFDLTGATISYHLKVLTKSKILVRKKQGLQFCKICVTDIISGIKLFTCKFS